MPFPFRSAFGQATFNPAIPGAIGGTTPAAGAFTTLSNSGLHTPTGGIKGRSTAANATAGNVGEYVESIVTAVAAAATTVYQDLTTISLTAGDWDVTLHVESNFTAASTTQFFGGISTGTAGNAFSDGVQGSNRFNLSTGGVGVSAVTLSVPNLRLSLSATTTVMAKTYYVYSAGAPTTSGRLSARRVQPGT